MGKNYVGEISLRQRAVQIIVCELLLRCLSRFKHSQITQCIHVFSEEFNSSVNKLCTAYFVICKYKILIK